MGNVTRNNTLARKLTSEQVIRLRELYNQGWTQNRLCQEFDLSIGMVGKIVRNESWRKLPPAMARPETVAESGERMMRLQEGLRRQGLVGKEK